jgi:hypothetical protein
MRIVDAARRALESLGGGPATTKEVHAEIVRLELYFFGAKSPLSVLGGAMREKAVDSPRLKGDPMFLLTPDGRYRVVG